MTPAEIKERDRLRKKYLEAVRGATKNMLLNAKIVDAEGRDVTPKKLVEEQDQLKKTRS